MPMMRIVSAMAPSIARKRAHAMSNLHQFAKAHPVSAHREGCVEQRDLVTDRIDDGLFGSGDVRNDHTDVVEAADLRVAVVRLRLRGPTGAGVEGDVVVGPADMNRVATIDGRTLPATMPAEQPAEKIGGARGIGYGDVDVFQLGRHGISFPLIFQPVPW